MPRDTYRIAVILPVETEYSNRIMEGAISYTEEHLDIELIEIPYIRESRRPPPMGPGDFDAALTYLSETDTWIRNLLTADIPVVNTSGDWRDRGVTIVAFDGRHMQKCILDHVVQIGHSSVAHVSDATKISSELTCRKNLFLSEAAKRGMSTAHFDLEEVERLDNRILAVPASIEEDLRRFLRDLPCATSIWCEDDYVARLVCSHALAIGLRIPQDLSVIGVGDYTISRSGKPTISTIPVPGELAGRRATEQIHQILSGTVEATTTVIRLPSPPVIIRETSGGDLLVDERFLRVRQWIHDHACKGIQVSDVTALLPMSQFTFTKHFTRLFGTTPGEEIRRIKLSKAQSYLRSTRLSVERISELCGFEQQGKFSKFFKRETGLTPSEYRLGKREECA